MFQYHCLAVTVKRYHVLCEALRQADLMTLLHEVPDGKCVSFGIPTCEALVCHIEERIMPLLLDYIADLPPLILAGINACGVVGASVQ